MKPQFDSHFVQKFIVSIEKHVIESLLLFDKCIVFNTLYFMAVMDFLIKYFNKIRFFIFFLTKTLILF